MDILRPNGIEETIKKNSYGMEIGGKSLEALMAEFSQNRINVSERAGDMMRSPAFSTLDRPTKIWVVRLTPGDLGFTRHPTTEQFFDQGQSFGLEQLPAEASPHARLQDINQRPGDCYHIAMDPITDLDGDPYLFRLERYGGRLWLRGDWAGPGRRWDLDDAFVFRSSQVI